MDIILSVITREGVPIFTFPSNDDNLLLISSVASAINAFANRLGFGNVNSVETEKGIVTFKSFDDKLFVLFIRDCVKKDFLDILFYFITKELEITLDIIDINTPVSSNLLEKINNKFAKTLDKVQEVIDTISKLNIFYEKTKRVFGEEAKEFLLSKCNFISIENDELKLDTNKIMAEDMSLDTFIHLMRQCIADVKKVVREKTNMLG